MMIRVWYVSWKILSEETCCVCLSPFTSVFVDLQTMKMLLWALLCLQTFAECLATFNAASTLSLHGLSCPPFLEHVKKDHIQQKSHSYLHHHQVFCGINPEMSWFYDPASVTLSLAKFLTYDILCCKTLFHLSLDGWQFFSVFGLDCQLLATFTFENCSVHQNHTFMRNFELFCWFQMSMAFADMNCSMVQFCLFNGWVTFNEWVCSYCTSEFCEWIPWMSLFSHLMSFMVSKPFSCHPLWAHR